MAIFAYIDETGTSALDDADQPVLTIVAALVEENQVQPLAESIRALAMRALGWRPAVFELHGTEIFHGTGHWSALDPAHRIEAYTSHCHRSGARPRRVHRRRPARNRPHRRHDGDLENEQDRTR